jgi:hypothetical protein
MLTGLCCSLHCVLSLLIQVGGIKRERKRKEKKKKKKKQRIGRGYLTLLLAVPNW